MTSPPIFRINCRRASEVKLGNRTRNGVLITSEDLSTLRLLANRDLAVSLECDGVIIFQANVKALLRRTIYLADRNLWYVPTTLTGPLKPPLPPGPDDY